MSLHKLNWFSLSVIEPDPPLFDILLPENSAYLKWWECVFGHR